MSSGFLKRDGRLCSEKLPLLGTFGRQNIRYIAVMRANIPTPRNVDLHPILNPIRRPNGNPKIIATEVPVTIILRARGLECSGTILTASGETIDQKMACVQATPMREAMSI